MTASPTVRPRGRWGRLAARLRLVPLARRGARRCLVGERDSRLVAIWSSHGLNASSVDVLVRYPQKSTVRGLRESLLTAPELASAFGRKSALPRSRRGDLFVADGSVVMRLKYSFFPPTANRIERVLDGLVAALDRETRSLERICESCQQSRDPAVCLVDGFPGYFCDGCIEQHVRGESDRVDWVRSIPGSYGASAALGLAAAGAFGFTGGALAAIVAAKVATPVFLNPSGALILLLAIAAGYGVSLVALRGLQNFRIRSGLFPLPFAWLAAVLFSGTMWLVSRQISSPAEYSLRLVESAFVADALRRPTFSIALVAAVTAGFLVAALARIRWLIAARRSSRVERVEGI
jgi:hypothetical protein